MNSVVDLGEADPVTAGGNKLPATALRSPASGTRFVINLTSSTSPVSLKQPSHPGLKRFTFFVSRRLEEGRERFRMHMGYFDSQEEAEKLLDIVREIYPAAWAGVAPGMRLRAGAMPPITGREPPATDADAAAKPAAAVVPAATAPTGPAAAAVSVPAPTIAPSPPVTVSAAPIAAPASAQSTAPALSAAPPATVSAPLEVSAPFELSVDLQLQDPPPPIDAAAGALSNMREVLASLDDSGSHAPTLNPLPELKPNVPVVQPARSLDDAQVLKVLEASGSRSASAIAPSDASPTSAANSGRYEVPISLMTASGTYATLPSSAVADNDATMIAPAGLGAQARGPTSTPPPVPQAPVRPTAPQALTQSSIPTGSIPKGSTPKMPASQASPSPVAAAAAPVPAAPRTQPVPARVAMGQPAPATDSSAADSGARREVAAYAVQLMWSVQPIRVEQVAQLAIFSAYTLYAAEGNRDGRRWYGLRLGFFTDPISARQVAQYVRSEFSSVSVVPVTERERDRAGTAPVHPTLAVAKADSAKTDTGPSSEYRLLDDSGSKKLAPPASKVDPRLAALARIAKPLPPGTPSTPGKRAKQRVPAPLAAAAPATNGKGARPGKSSKPRKAMTLEETLEILGADKLEMTQEGGELLSETGVRHMSMQAVKAKRGPNSRIGRLFERLSERMGGS